MEKKVCRETWGTKKAGKTNHSRQRGKQGQILNSRFKELKGVQYDAARNGIVWGWRSSRHYVGEGIL